MRMLPVFGVLFLLFALQSLGTVYQVRQYRSAVRRVHKLGNVGIGQKKGGFSFGHLVLIVCDSNGMIKHAEVMEGATILARFRKKEKLLGKEISGSHIQDFLKDFTEMTGKQRKRYKGYIQALEALELRLYPDEFERRGTLI